MKLHIKYQLSSFRSFLKVFCPIRVYVKQVTLGGAIFDPRAIICTILVEVHWMCYIPNIKGLGLILLDKMTFAYRSLWKKSTFLHKKRSMWTQSYHIFKLYWAHIPNAAYQDPGPYTLWFRRRRSLKGFTIYGCGSQLGHATVMRGTNFHSPYPLRLIMKFGFDWTTDFWKEDIWRVFPIWVYVKQVTLLSALRVGSLSGHKHAVMCNACEHWQHLLCNTGEINFCVLKTCKMVWYLLFGIFCRT